MSDNLHDVRTKVCERDHAVLAGVSQATGQDIAGIVRDLISEFADRELHRARTVLAVTRGREGTSGSDRE